jgi:ABC-type transport system substrate-binding protein
MDTWNAGRWNSPEFGRLVGLAPVEADEKRRKQYYDAAVKLIVDEAPAAAILHANGRRDLRQLCQEFRDDPG